MPSSGPHGHWVVVQVWLLYERWKTSLPDHILYDPGNVRFQLGVNLVKRPPSGRDSSFFLPGDLISMGRGGFNFALLLAFSFLSKRFGRSWVWFSFGRSNLLLNTRGILLFSLLNRLCLLLHC